MLDVLLPMLRCHIAPIPAPELPGAQTRLQPSPLTNGPGESPSLAAPATGLPGLPADFQQQLNLLQAQQEKLLAQEQQQLTKLTGVPGGTEIRHNPRLPTAPAHRNADLNRATGKDHVIFEGTVLESVLVNRLNGDFAGPVICQISTDVYSRDHSELLVPAGSRVLGETKKVNDVGQERLAVVFHRLIMPDGYAVDLDQAPGLSQIGETALHDKVNNHYFRDLWRLYRDRSNRRTFHHWRKQQRRYRSANVQCQRLPGRCSSEVSHNPL